MPMPDGATYWVADAWAASRSPGFFRPTGREYKALPEAWMSYLAVDDVDARVKKALAAGAKLMQPIFDVPHVGRHRHPDRARRRRRRLDDAV